MDDVVERVGEVIEGAFAKARANVIEPSMKRVAVLPWPEMENCYLVVSGQRRRQEQVGERWYLGHEEQRNKFSDFDIRTDARITFTYAERGVAAEWNGESGPIQLWFRCEADYEQGYDKAREHWLWPHAHGAGHWSQMAVSEADLPRRFNEGDWEGIFAVLRGWVKSRLDEAA